MATDWAFVEVTGAPGQAIRTSVPLANQSVIVRNQSEATLPPRFSPGILNPETPLIV